MGLDGQCWADEKIHFILLFSRQGKLRLQKWYTTLPDKERKKITREIVQIILSRGQRTSSFIDWKELKLVYKRYASLYFCCAVENQDNELLTLEIVHRYVELLDKYFGNVCELDIIFNFEKAYFILDEFIIGGEVQETSKKSAVTAIEDSDMLQEVSTKLPPYGEKGGEEDDDCNMVEPGKAGTQQNCLIFLDLASFPPLTRCY
ncbi:AP-1 complex subunit sigma-3 [Orycteropus afer afer]|uniref:AP-1 complex subunit sigma-3 n=1 Tax=Orycteropus afer afer TaxID=1230840 RepID=A0AC54ZBM7_ORYAF|nr:AP-1 complex subunit sigma-3 [Orycteropus afer afer]